MIATRKSTCQGMSRSRCLITLTLLSMATATRVWSASPVRVLKAGDSLTLSNNYLACTIEFGNGVVRTTAFRNKLSGSVYAVSGNEFSLKIIGEMWKQDSRSPFILTTRDFRLTDKVVEDVIGGGKRVIFRVTQIQSDQPYTGIKGTLTFELMPTDYYIRKWLRVEAKTKGTYFIDSVVVEDNLWFPAQFSVGGFGQPLLGDDIFLGLEYPSGENIAKGSRVTLGYVVGEAISNDGFTSEPAVLGVSTKGRAHTAFMNYIERIRLTPPRPFIVYESFYSFPPAYSSEGTLVDATNIRPTLSDLERQLTEKQGIRLDSLTTDGGWDDLDNLWAFDPKRFPNGFRDLMAEVKNIAGGIGIWLGPDGGYGKSKQRRIAAASRQGLEVTASHQFLCMAGQNYSRFLKDTLLRLSEQEGVNYFKFDGIEFTCNDPDHGHPVGIYSRAASVRVLIEILKAIHASNPHAFLALATGPWRSPWWLRYADSVDFGAGDYGYLQSLPSLTQRQSAISYNDFAFYNIYKVEHAQFPMSSLDGDGLIKAKYNQLGGKNESLDDWNDALIDLIANGLMHIDLYISPQLLRPKEWETLGQVLRYIKANAHPLLDNGTFVLGNPARREPYGFLHYSPNKTIIVLRNPWVGVEEASLRLNAQAGFMPTHQTYEAEVEFPFRKVLKNSLQYGDPLKMNLDGYEERVVEIRPVNTVPIDVEGVRYAVLSLDKNRREVVFGLYGQPGESTTIQLSPASAMGEVYINGDHTKIKPKGDKISLPLHFGDGLTSQKKPSASAPSIKWREAGASHRNLTVSIAVQIPSDCQEAQLDLLVEPAQQISGITATGQTNRVPVSIGKEDGGAGRWYWFEVGMKPGSNSTQFNIRFPRDIRDTITISGWLRAKHLLVKKELRVALKRGQVGDLALQNSLPATSSIKRTTYRLFEQTVR